MSHFPDIVRKGFGLRREVAGELARDYESELVSQARLAGHALAWPGLKVRIAKEFGFCYGVERAVDYAYETRRHFPGRRLLITGEIIHNPGVNTRLRELGYEFLDGGHGSTVAFEDVGPEDVVLIPAFGVTVDLLTRLRETGALLVDTTCGSVLNVWKNVERFAREGYTCLIHGKWDHEETRATASRALQYPGGKVLVVRNLEETHEVAGFIRAGEGADGEAFLRRFAQSVSESFDPRRDLQRVGMANQTTMLSSESLEVARVIRQALEDRWGSDAIDEHFRAFDTICSATEDRQQAVLEMMESPPELMIIIGGYNSSNTGHLAEICAQKVPTYHVEGAGELLSAGEIRHRLPDTGKMALSRGWLPEKDLEVGITAGASTPDREIGAVICRLLELRGIDPSQRFPGESA
ncbi:MAG: 4-hydroxy-3-methylbut-2-enyl diphosphate reductase [Acidobacteriota bacterium]|nr:4-hydroxy-3-methylbut-2-enyl diphosphate reductase [Acidobacteriota bacterium]